MNGPGREPNAKLLALIDQAQFNLLIFLNLCHDNPKMAWVGLVELTRTLSEMQALCPPRPFTISEHEKNFIVSHK